MTDLKSRFDVLALSATEASNDLRTLDAGLRAFTRDLAASIESAKRTFADMAKGTSSAEGGEGAGVKATAPAGDGGVQQTVSGLESLASLAPMVGAEIRGALASAMTPLLGIGQTLTQQINQLGGTFVTLARRIDSSMKFPAMDAFLTKLREKAPEAWQKNTLAAGQFAYRAQYYLSSMGDVASKGLGKINAVRFDPVTASARKLSISIKMVTNVSRTATTAAAGMGRSLLAAFGFMGVAWEAVSFLKTGVKGASDLNETISRTQSILGDAGPAAMTFADGMAKSFGLVKKDLLDAESAFGGLGKGLGKLAGGELSDFSNQFTKLAADLSSWANMDFSEAMGSLQTALAGNQSDRLKELGVILTDDAVRARAVAEGFAASAKEVSESAKFQARAIMIAEKLADANDDLAKTAWSPANMYRRLKGTILNFATTVGGSLMPVLSKIGNAFASGLTVVTGAWERNQGLVTQFQEGAFLAFETLKGGFESITQLAGELPSAIDGAFGANTMAMIQGFGEGLVKGVGDAISGVGSFVRNMPEYFHIAIVQAAKWTEVLSQTLTSFGTWFADNWSNVIIDSLQLVGRAFADLATLGSRLGEAIANFLSDPTKGFQIDWTPFLHGFQAATAKLPGLARPDLNAFQDEIDKTWDKVAEKDRALREKVKADVVAANAAPPANKPAPFKPAADETKQADKKDKKSGRVEQAGAYELGSKEAYSAVVGALNSVNERILTEARRQTLLLKEMRDDQRTRREAIRDQGGPALLQIR